MMIMRDQIKQETNGKLLLLMVLVVVVVVTCEPYVPSAHLLTDKNGINLTAIVELASLQRCLVALQTMNRTASTMLVIVLI